MYFSAKMDVGSSEFWGSAGVVWMTFFIMYCILFYAALFGVFFYWGYSLYSFRYRMKHRFILRYYSVRYRLLYLLTLQIFWFAFSFVHGILIINSVASGSDNTVVAVVIRTVETVTSFTFVNIIITAPQVFFPWFSLIRIVLSNLIIYLLSMAILVTSISLVGSSATFLVELIILRSLMFIASVILLVIYFKTQFFMRRRDKGLYIILACLYFSISYSYFLYTLSMVVSNSDCIENVQLHRAIWLVLNCLLRICEVSFFILKIRVFITESKPSVSSNSKADSIKCHARHTHLCLDHNTSKVSNFEHNSRETKGTTTYHMHNSTKSMNLFEEDIVDTKESEKVQFQQIETVKDNSQKIEVERLLHSSTANENVTLDKRDCEVLTHNIKCVQLSQSPSCQSALLNQLKVDSASIDPEQNYCAVDTSDIDDRDTLSDILDGKAMNMYKLYSYVCAAM